MLKTQDKNRENSLVSELDYPNISKEGKQNENVINNKFPRKEDNLKWNRKDNRQTIMFQHIPLF